MNSVGKAAMEMVNEVRRQFKDIAGIMEGTGTPDYSRCVDISTKAALREMLIPGAMTIVFPVLIGFVVGAEAAWDNAKKSLEAGIEVEGEKSYVGSEAHKASVTGDTVGDPFKDTSGPSMNILIKLTCLVGLVIAPILGGHGSEGSHASSKGAEIRPVTEVIAPVGKKAQLVQRVGLSE